MYSFAMVASNSQLGSPTKTARKGASPTARSILSRQEAQYDIKLVSRFNAGDEAAFVEIVKRYRGKMFSIALCHLRNHADAEEITQDTFIRAHRGLARFRGDSSLATWLHRIAFNLSRNRYKYYFCRRRHAMLSLDCAFSDDNHATFSDLIASDARAPTARRPPASSATSSPSAWASSATASARSFASERPQPVLRRDSRQAEDQHRHREEPDRARPREAPGAPLRVVSRAAGGRLPLRLV
jgi:RNA polymerase sigma factor (sigma-70 family)